MLLSSFHEDDGMFDECDGFIVEFPPLTHQASSVRTSHIPKSKSQRRWTRERYVRMEVRLSKWVGKVSLGAAQGTKRRPPPQPPRGGPWPLFLLLMLLLRLRLLLLLLFSQAILGPRRFAGALQCGRAGFSIYLCHDSRPSLTDVRFHTLDLLSPSFSLARFVSPSTGCVSLSPARTYPSSSRTLKGYILAAFASTILAPLIPVSVHHFPFCTTFSFFIPTY